MGQSPLEQALEFKRLLLERLADANCEPPEHGVAVVSPDVPYDDAPTPGRPRRRRASLARPGLPWGSSTARCGRRAGNWIELIHRLWGETWIPCLTLAMRVRRAADDRVPLDDRQLALLDALDDNTRLLVDGAAGSGARG